MKQVLIHKGTAAVHQVPAPVISKGAVLVEVAYSLISTGTEMAGMQQSQKSLLQQAVEEPAKIQKLIDHLRSQGINKTIAKLQGKLSAGSPTGYSCAGVVVTVGEDIQDIKAGDRVACAGAGIANHAELVLVPRNLVVKIPEECDLRNAASVTLGAIAMQGVRRANLVLGENVAVVGLGLLGQLTVQLLKASGCTVIGFDLDARRVEMALENGADRAFVSSDSNVPNEIRHLTGNYGVDAAIITAASSSDAIVQQAMEITRKKGRVVVVGAVGLGLQRSPFYEKEIDFLISCSYGPGRYDPRYETQGLDYPYAYVRWTENRNMRAYLDLIAVGKLKLESIITAEYPVEEADKAYAALQGDGEKPMGVLLSYGTADSIAKQETSVTLKPYLKQDKINLAVVGAGDFAKFVHLPNIRKLSDQFHLRAVVSATGSNAHAVAKQFEADYASTALEDVLVDETVDAVLIATRHDLHAQQALRAARAGKAIFLEKPMALNQAELEDLESGIKESGVPIMVGFNRRFSPAARRAKEIIAGRKNPLMALYRVNGGFIPPEHWVQTESGGGRIIGEACHMLDLFNYLVGTSQVESVDVSSLAPAGDHLGGRDNFVVTVRYMEGSVCTLLYTALGAGDLGKERLEIFCDGKSLVVDDFKRLSIFGSKQKGWSSPEVDKGHLREMQLFAKMIKEGGQWPISLNEMLDVTRLTFTIDEMSRVS